MTDLRPLLARLEEATGPDHEIDALIAKQFGWVLVRNEYWERPKDWKPLELMEGLPLFTSSIDASLALVEKKLPGWSYSLQTEEHHENGFRAELWPSWGPTAYKRVKADAAKTAPLAILIALLRALISNQTDPGEGRSMSIWFWVSIGLGAALASALVVYVVGSLVVGKIVADGLGKFGRAWFRGRR